MNGRTNSRQMTKCQLMDTINQSSFAVDEMILYLDTHPDDAEMSDSWQGKRPSRLLWCLII